MDVRETLIRNEYYVAGSFKDGTVIITFPMDKEPKLRSFKYELGENDINGHEMVRYAIPVVILIQLYLCALTCDYDIDLIIYEIDGKDTTSAEFLTEITERYSDEEIAKAAALLLLSKELDPSTLQVLREAAKKEDVEEGFDIIEGMIRKAGLI